MQPITMRHDTRVSSCFTLAKTLRDAHEHAVAAAATSRSLCAACERG